MQVKIYVLFITLSFSLNISTAQNITKKGKNLYIHKGKTYTSKELGEILSTCKLSATLYEEYKIKKQNATDGYLAGTLLLAIGGGTTLYYSKNDCLEGHCLPGMILGIGVGLIGFTIELLAISNDIRSVKKLNQSIDIFNEDIKTSSTLYKPEILLKNTSNGVGLVFNF